MGFTLNTGSAAKAVVFAALGASLLGGCASAGKAFGVSKVTPDEYRVVAKAPLALPPDYSLRPPAPGEPRPQELQPESQARAALLGRNNAAGRSNGETLLANKAGAERADPLIRYVVDDEFGDIAHKDESFVKKVLSFGSGSSAATAAPTASDTGANTASPLNPDAAVSALTGANTVVISRGGGKGIKLPGL